MKVVAFVIGCVQAYSGSLGDCEAFAALFSNTCSDEVATADWNSASTQQITCTGANICVGDTEFNKSNTHNCQHQSKLCVTCKQTNKVWIRVQTNSMPFHCYTSPEFPNNEARAPIYYDWDWTVEWNKDVYRWENYGSGEIKDQQTTDALLCNHEITKFDNVPSFFTLNQGADIERAVGVARDNTLIFNSLSAFEVDTVDLDLLSDKETFQEYFDDCLGYIDTDQYYAYRALSKCLKTNPNRLTPGINTLVNTIDLGETYKERWISTADYGKPFGLAKDGHVIFGPYNKDGELWSCEDVDFCNGFFLADQSYVYASTTFYPYTVGCWGPAEGQLGQFTPSCTSNACNTSLSGF